MKWILSALSMVLAFNVYAADKKVGNVIAVERTLENVFATCIDEVQKDKTFDPNAQYFGCGMDAISGNESVPGNQRLLRVRTETCTVDADIVGTRAVIMFNGMEKKANFASARACLETALRGANNGSTLKFTVFTVE
jgi:hypothetical protein